MPPVKPVVSRSGKLVEEIINLDNAVALRAFKSNSMDLVIYDPPYFKGNTDTWNLPDFNEQGREIRRVLKMRGLVAFFGYQPLLHESLNSDGFRGFSVLDELIWVKNRPMMAQGTTKKLLKAHISIWILRRVEAQASETKYSLDRVVGIEPAKRKKKESEGVHKILFGSEESVVRSVEVGYPWSTFHHDVISSGSEYVGHPTQVPLKIMELIIQLCTEPGDTVLDPFLGSGTTGLACHNLQRNWFGIEIDKEWCRKAYGRIFGGVSQWLLPV